MGGKMLPDWNVELIFSAEAASRVGKIHYHETQQNQEQEDGTLKVQLTVSDLNQMVWWILSYGQHVKVVSPPELQKMVLEYIHTILQVRDGKTIHFESFDEDLDEEMKELDRTLEELKKKLSIYAENGNSADNQDGFLPENDILE